MPTILLTNDDGPPNPKNSPFVLGLYHYLRNELGWDVKVVIPNAQKSWIGKAYHIKEITKGSYFYPKENGEGEMTLNSRPLKDGELAEWILLDGTPATCTNVALHNIYPGAIDLVISGPNYGRNTSAAFSLSSGTVGAAMSASLSRVRAIAVSYGIVENPPPTAYTDPAHKLAAGIIKHLWENWGSDEHGLRNGEIDLYNVNIPLVGELLTDEGPKICWAKLWRNSYGRLFKNVAGSTDPRDKVVKPGPDAPARTVSVDQRPSPEDAETGDLLFKWSPDMEGLIRPDLSNLPVGSDGWAIHHGHICVTPLRATFAEPNFEEVIDEEKITWKMKL